MMERLEPLSTPDSTGAYQRILQLGLAAGEGLELLLKSESAQDIQSFDSYCCARPSKEEEEDRTKKAMDFPTSVLAAFIGGILLLLALSAPTTTAALSPTSVQRFYGLVGPALDLLSIVEDPPRNRALELADLAESQSILEIGPGTGRTAKLILEANPQWTRYTGFELTPRMAQLATSKIGEINSEVATIVQGNCLEDDWGSEQQYDRILAFYVLDIFSPDQIRTFLQKSRQCLAPNGKLILVSLTNPKEQSSLLSKAVMGLWTKISNAVPILLGGCRPIQLAQFLKEDDGWKLEHCEQMSVLGYTSEIVIASKE